ncbi:ankyrin repeat and IBR domain-containing protein 1-like isoform X1 [Limulus polyphemus]|uniref:RBR-type E3 ubiquitin transferase n=2 Tax=Limulus polyphemus TaxID=6850 RepID=A0ABM1SK35_LIMPO|nr:ankyrin repeat and IBR domain-containing protein 1-like isoform X1 [Limulus polyphemus]
MGSASSKFRKHLQKCDEYAALQVFQNTPELRRTLDPNCSYGDSLQHNTPLHLAAKHAMKPLLRIFLNELGGNPNKKNGSNKTALHLACQGNLIRSLSTQERRAACVSLILQWRGPLLANGEEERINLSAVDEEGNTSLHYAAATGLKKCVELLSGHGAPLFIENNDKDTACDLAERAEHEDIAHFLESKMLFSTDSGCTSLENDFCCENLEDYTGLRQQDLQEAKDQLLVETADMLHVPLFTAEALLRNYEWSRETLLEAWVSDPVACCQKSGVQPPPSALQQLSTASVLDIQSEDEYLNKAITSVNNIDSAKKEFLCEICASFITKDKDPVHVPCLHNFCQSCWKGYLTVKIQDGDAHSIMCPAYKCPHLVPVDVIEKLVSPEMVRRYLQFDIEAFVESNPNIKWCPFPGCGQAVRLPENEITTPEFVAIPNTSPPSPVSHAVDCGNGHYFCWECLSEAHAPCDCDRWREWHAKIAEIKPEELRTTCARTEDAANCLWLVTNSKPCPSCKSPIQKNEGCNHMKCSKCKHDFCWVCLESWKRHSSATGGYFRCNRYDAVHKAEERTGMLICEAEAKNKQMQELKRFVHYYTRFKNHENSHKLEEPLLDVIREKIEILTSNVDDPVAAELETRFLEEAVRELLRARRVLCGSYVYGYYLEDNGYNKTIFEFMQHDLEEAAEKLSEMVARPYLRTPRDKIIQSTIYCRRKRHEFVTAVSKGLIPPETPPSLRRTKHRRYPGLMGIDSVEDEQISQAIMASLWDMDPQNPWVKDVQGRHSNLSAIYDWPDCDSDDSEAYAHNALTVSILGVCARKGCQKARARNPRTGTLHEYCSLQCLQNYTEGVEDRNHLTYELDYSMDLLIALEMSRLQMIEDMNRVQLSRTESTVKVTEDTYQNDMNNATPVKHNAVISNTISACATTNTTTTISVSENQEKEPHESTEKEVFEDPKSCDNQQVTSSDSLEHFMLETAVPPPEEFRGDDQTFWNPSESLLEPQPNVCAGHGETTSDLTFLANLQFFMKGSEEDCPYSLKNLSQENNTAEKIQKNLPSYSQDYNLVNEGCHVDQSTNNDQPNEEELLQ